jgi:hypothetical protein
LAAELADWPSATIDAVVTWLESGKKPSKGVSRHAGNGSEKFRNKLPPGEFYTGKAKRGVDGRQALLKFS